ncbi:MAG: hypothetical protein ABJE47_25405, partial [bacterium]
VPVKAFRLGGFNGVISYAVTGAPVGLDAAMMSTARPDSSTLVLVAQSTLANGSYRVVVTGRAPGATDQTLPVAVTVNTAPSATRATGIALRR